jgi:hypothetical protein
MFKKYLEFIFQNSEKLSNLKDIIYINNKLLNNLYNKKYNNNYHIKSGGSNGSETNEKKINEYSKKIDEFKESTVSILNTLNSKLINVDELKNVDDAINKLIEYHNLLFQLFKDKDLEKIKNQLSELKQIISNKIEVNDK